MVASLPTADVMDSNHRPSADDTQLGNRGHGGGQWVHYRMRCARPWRLAPRSFTSFGRISDGMGGMGDSPSRDRYDSLRSSPCRRKIRLSVPETTPVDHGNSPSRDDSLVSTRAPGQALFAITPTKFEIHVSPLVLPSNMMTVDGDSNATV